MITQEKKKLKCCFFLLLCRELDENMRKSFHKFLETRGIKASATDFLYEYMMKKDSREYLLWLKKLKTFVQE